MSRSRATDRRAAQQQGRADPHPPDHPQGVQRHGNNRGMLAEVKVRQRRIRRAGEAAETRQHLRSDRDD